MTTTPDLPTRTEIQEAYEAADALLDDCIALREKVRQREAEYEPLDEAFEADVEDVDRRLEELREEYERRKAELWEERELYEMAQDGVYSYYNDEEGNAPSLRKQAEDQDGELVALRADLAAKEDAYKAAQARYEELDEAVVGASLEKRAPKTGDELGVWVKKNVDAINAAVRDGRWTTRLAADARNARMQTTARAITRLKDGSGFYRVHAYAANRWSDSEDVKVYARIGFKGQLVGVAISESYSDSYSSWTDGAYWNADGGDTIYGEGIKNLTTEINEAEAA